MRADSCASENVTPLDKANPARTKRVKECAQYLGGVCMFAVEWLAKVFFTNPLLILLIAAAVAAPLAVVGVKTSAEIGRAHV